MNNDKTKKQIDWSKVQKDSGLTVPELAEQILQTVVMIAYNDSPLDELIKNKKPIYVAGIGDEVSAEVFIKFRKLD